LRAREETVMKSFVEHDLGVANAFARRAAGRFPTPRRDDRHASEACRDPHSNPRSTVVEGFGQGLNTQVVELAGCHFAKDRHRLRNA